MNVNTGAKSSEMHIYSCVSHTKHHTLDFLVWLVDVYVLVQSWTICFHKALAAAQIKFSVMIT